MEDLAERADEVGSGKVLRGRHSERSKETGLIINQGRRVREQRSVLDNFLFEQGDVAKTRKYYQQVFDDVHEREELPDLYKDTRNEYTAAPQTGLEELSYRNYKKAHARMRSSQYFN